MANFRKDTQTFGPRSHDVTVFEVPMIANKNGEVVSESNPFPVRLSNLVSESTRDAFNRLRVSTPLTLFDSTHRYSKNDLWVENITGTANSSFNINAGLVEMNVGSASGDEIILETTKTFSYQPGKSLLIFNSFVFNESKTNLRQRVGYFGENNGIYLELNNEDIYFVKRSSVTGTVVETRISQENWNVDKLDGTGISNYTLDLSKVQILYMDLEWLGAGTVRCGFVIDGIFLIAHAFHHSNNIDSTYMTTASLPLRQEITNTDSTGSSSQSKQICSTVIIEGGYELRGRQTAIQTPITTPKDLATEDIYYPVISIRLKSSPDRLDAIVILTAISLLGITNNANYNWQVVASGTTSGGSWVSAGTDSAVEYNVTGTSFTLGTGRILASGWLQGSNQGSSTIDILKEALFKFQLERNSFTNTAFELTLLMASDSAGADVYTSLDFEEVSR